VIEEGSGVGGAVESACGDGGDDDAADDEEEIDAEDTVLEDVHEVSGAVFALGAAEVSEDDEESGQTATDLNADDASRLVGWCVCQTGLPFSCLTVSMRWVCGSRFIDW